MELTKYTNKKSACIITFAFLLSFYYIIPQSYALVINAIIIILSLENFKRIATFLPIKWNLAFITVLLLLTLFRVDNLAYLISSINVGVILFTQILILNDKKDINLFMNSVTVSGFLLCLFINYKFAHLFGIGRLGMEMPGTRIDSAITLGYILLYISCIQIYTIFNNDNVLYKAIIGIAIIFTLYLTLHTGTRKALLIPIAYFLFCLFIEYKKSFLKLIFITAITLFTLTKAIGYIAEKDIIDKKMVERWEGLIGFVDQKTYIDDSSEERVDHIEKATDIFQNNSVFGIGINETIKYIGTHAHNNFMTLLAFGGMVLFISYYWIYAYFFTHRKSMLKSMPRIFVMAAIIVPLSDMGTTSFNIAYFNVMLALLMISYKIELKKNDKIKNYSLEQR